MCMACGGVRALVPFFNISTRGGSATWWIATILRQHPDIVCLHGREGPFAKGEPEPAAVLQVLEAERTRTGGKTVGAVHLFYGTEPCKAFVAAGGTFTCVLRNPLTRIHSLFTHHCRLDLRHSAPEGAPIYQSLIDAGLATGAPVSTIPFVTVEATRPADVLFRLICDSVLAFDRDILTNAPDGIALFERLTEDRGYLFDWLGRLLGGADDLLSRAVDAGFDNRVNSHVGDARLTPEEVFEVWPDAFRKAFLRSMLLQDWNPLLTAYASVGYAFPQLNVDLLQRHV